MTPVYIFCGLGTDKRVFQNINFFGFIVHYIEWIAPSKGETIHSYAQRLTEQIHFNKPVFIGLSFGGIMAVEVAKIIEPRKIILISSAKTKHEIPFYFRAAGALQLHKLIPTLALKHPNRLTYWLFGVENTAEKSFLASVLKGTDEAFLKWAVDAIATWENEYEPKNLVHLHGTADRILPHHFIKKSVAIPGGGHFMVVNKGTLLTNMLRNLISSSNIPA